MLTHSGHGSVTALKPNITQTKDVSPQCARVMIRRITAGSAALGKDQLDVGAACPQCDHPAGSPESLERHSVRCPNGGQRHYMHAGLVSVIVAILLMAGVPKSSIILEKKGLRSCDHTRPGDIVALEFFGLGRHLVIDAVVSTVYRNTILSKTSTIPGYMLPSWRKTRSSKLMRSLRSLYQASMEVTMSLFPLPWRMAAP